MEASELRIGNLVEFDGKILKASIIDLSILLNPNAPVTHDLYKPIPLTEEWLVEFGFVQSIENDDWMVIDGNLTMLKNGVSVAIGCYHNWKNLGASCLHVHQLQNLYFALTGEELTLQH